MHRRIVEAILHRPPGVAKHLSPFSRTINFHAHVKADSPSRAFTATGCATAPGGSRRGAGATTKRNRINRASFTEEQGATIARDVQIRNASAESTATTRTAFAFTCWWAT